MRAVVAVDQSYGIGKDGALLQHVSADLKRFKQITTGGVVIYGRKTLATFPGGKALPRRENIMLTSNTDLTVPHIETVDSLAGLFSLLEKKRRKGVEQDRIFVIGGGTVYEQLLPYLNEILITRFKETYEADRWFPNLAENKDFVCIETSEWQTEGDVTFRFETWRRIAREITVKTARKKDLQQLARRNPGDMLNGTLKDRRSRLEQYDKTGRQAIYVMWDGDNIIGYVLAAPELVGPDAGTALLHSTVSLSGGAVSSLLAAVFDDHPGLYSLVLSADSRVVLSGELPELTFVTLPGVSADRMLFIAARPHFSRLTVGFYPFELGLVALQSDGESITCVDFLRDGAVVTNERFRMTLKAERLLDRNDVLAGRPAGTFRSRPEDRPMNEAFAWLNAYFAGEPLPGLPPLSTRSEPEFTKKVMLALKEIPFGEHLTYAELAAVIVGEDKAADYARAVGQACSANPYALFVPCHRVLGNRGDLVGFSGGIEVKDYLLNHELVSRLEQVSKKKSDA